MPNLRHPSCPRRSEFTAYLNGDARGEQKAAFERHLCVCDECFETLLEVLNDDLDQAGPEVFLLAAPRRQRATCG